MPPGLSPGPSSQQSNTIQRPSILKPVQPPSKRDGSMVSGSERNIQADGYQSASNQLFNGGYMSQGGQSDNESGRLSNPHSFKLNNMNAMNIRKVSPNGGLAQPINNIQTQNRQVVGGTIDPYSSGGENIQKSNLPAIQKNMSIMKSSQKDGIKSRGSNRTNGGMAGGMHHGANDSTVGSTAVGMNNNLSKNTSNRASNNQTAISNQNRNSIKRVNVNVI